ncbi:uncharacterized [Tachysurus ichikawai]
MVSEKLQSRIEASSQMDSNTNPEMHYDIPQKHLRLLFHPDREQVDEGDVLSRDIDPNKYLASTVLCCPRLEMNGVVVSSKMALLPPLNPSNGPASSRFSAGRP